MLLACLTLGLMYYPSKPAYTETDYVRHSFLLVRPPSPQKMTRIISKHRKRRHSGLSDHLLAQKIISVSACLDLDAYIFAALIFQESSFNARAISHTNAVGLTQFTSAGVEEVNAQLGDGLFSRARPATTRWFHQRIQGCVVPRLKMRDFTPLFKLHYAPAEQKKILLNDPDYALIYGAVLLKTLVAVEKWKNPHSSAVHHYRNALRTYNGDSRAKERYQRDVMYYAWSFRRT